MKTTNNMNTLGRWIIKQLLDQKAQLYWGSYGLLKAAEYHPAVVWEPKNGRVLALAPHMDDEVIGCGGTLSDCSPKGICGSKPRTEGLT